MNINQLSEILKKKILINKIKTVNNLEKLFKKKHINKTIKFMKSDKKNNSDKINLILIKDFGKIKTDFQINSDKLKKFLLSELNN